MWESSPQGSDISSELTEISSTVGITCFRIGQSGLLASMRLKKCGVIESDSLLPDKITPFLSLLLRLGDSLID